MKKKERPRILKGNRAYNQEENSPYSQEEGFDTSFKRKKKFNLDIPGSELDNQQEDIGSEDEENNYYSIGGDRHDDLEEDRQE